MIDAEKEGSRVFIRLRSGNFSAKFFFSLYVFPIKQNQRKDNPTRSFKNNLPPLNLVSVGSNIRAQNRNQMEADFSTSKEDSCHYFVHPQMRDVQISTLPFLNILIDD
jgi:hypothetical protein